MLEREYAFTRTFEGVGFEDARERITAALKTEGFGVLTEIDVQATLKQKLGADFRPYAILGACNPPIAHRVLDRDPGIGLLLPCNVVVSVDDAGNAVVAVADPRAMMKVVGEIEDLVEPMREAREKLERALARA